MSAETNYLAEVPTKILVQLRDVADAVLHEICGAAHASLTIAHPGGWEALVATNADAEELAAVERIADGPTRATLRTGRISRLPSTTRPRAWPEFAGACRRHGINSVVAFPIVTGGHPLGVLCIASNDHFGFGKEETRIGVESAARASLILDAEFDRQ